MYYFFLHSYLVLSYLILASWHVQTSVSSAGSRTHKSPSQSQHAQSQSWLYSWTACVSAFTLTLVMQNSLFCCFDRMLTDVVEIQWVTSNSRFLMGSRRTITPLIGWFRPRRRRPDSSDAFLWTCSVFAALFIFICAWKLQLCTVIYY